MAKLKEKFNKSIIYYKINKNAILYFILRNLKIFIIFAKKYNICNRSLTGFAGGLEAKRILQELKTEKS